MYERTMEMKKKNGALKISISVGGWNHASKGFSDVVASEANMKKFVDQSIAFMRENGFDGLDMDWEYPGVASRGSKPGHKHAFTVLIQKLRAVSFLNSRGACGRGAGGPADCGCVACRPTDGCRYLIDNR